MAKARKSLRNKQLQVALLDSVAHELRTPLTSIKASVTALLTNSELPPPQRNELLIVINEEADRLNRLVGEAMKATRPSGRVKLDLRSHAIEAIIDAARQTAGGCWASERCRCYYQQDCHAYERI